MLCYNCGKKFYVKRNFLSLFETKKYYICNACQKAYPLEPSLEIIPLEDYNLYVLSLFRFLYRLNIDAYNKEISTIVSKTISNHKEYFPIYFDQVQLTDQMLEALSFIADGEKKSILLICCELKK